MKLITKNVTEQDSIEKVHAAIRNQKNVKERGVSITMQVYLTTNVSYVMEFLA